MDSHRTDVSATSPDSSDSLTVSPPSAAIQTGTLDDLDRKLTIALQQNGRASWTALAELLDVAPTTIARRGQELLKSGLIRIVGLPTLNTEGPLDIFLVHVRCAPGTLFPVARALANNPNVRFGAIVTGEFDLIIEFTVRGGTAHYPELIPTNLNIHGILAWRSTLVVQTYKMSHGWSRQLLTETLESPPAWLADARDLEVVQCDPTHLDHIDRKIIAALREDGRRSFQSISTKLELNESSVRRRFERLHGNHCVEIRTFVPSSLLGMSAETLINLRVTPRNMNALARKLITYPAVRFLASTLNENSLFCEIVTPSVQELSQFLTITIANLDGIEGWTAATELNVFKRGFVTLPWPGLADPPNRNP